LKNKTAQHTFEERITVMPAAALSTAAWVAHDLGTAIGVGGSLFGRVALEPSVHNVKDQQERGNLLMEAWRRFGIVQLGALAVMAGTWYAGRSKLGGAAVGGRGARGLVIAKDLLVGATFASAVGAAVTGNLNARQRRQQDVPINDQGEVAAEAPAPARQLGRVTDAFGLANLIAGVGVVAVTAMLAMRAGKSTRWSALSRLLP
jgi:uncharacterized membrane protein